MPRRDYVHCKQCGGHTSEVGDLSCTRLCLTCGLERLAENIEGMTTPGTRERQRYRRGIAKKIGAVLLEDLSPALQPRS